MKVTVSRSDAGALRRIIDNVKSMGLNKLEVGLPAGKSHSGTDLDMAELGAVHEFGSISRNIPARPFIRPSITENREKYIKLMRQQASKLIFRRVTLKNALSIVGEVAKSDIQKYMLTASFTPLSPETIKRKGSTRPLIDSAQMRNAITYEVK